MRLHKLKASDSTGTYLVESPVTETDILLMGRQLANLRLRRGRALASPKDVFSHLQALLSDYEHEVFALLHLDSRHRVIACQEMFRGTLDGASVYPREVVKTALEHNAAATVLVHNHPSGDPEPSQSDLTLTHKLQWPPFQHDELEERRMQAAGASHLTGHGELVGPMQGNKRQHPLHRRAQHLQPPS